MNTLHVLVWAVLGLTVGAVLAPTAACLAEVRHRALYRALMSVTTAVAFAALAQRYPVTCAMLALTVFAAVSVLLAAVDMLALRLPRTLVWPTHAAVGVLLVMEFVGTGASLDRLLRAMVGAAAMAGGYLLVALASRGGLGAGDVRAALLAGSVLGWYGWPVVLAGTMLGFLATGTITAACSGQRKAMPHGPGMLAGAFVALLL